MNRTVRKSVEFCCGKQIHYVSVETSTVRYLLLFSFSENTLIADKIGLLEGDMKLLPDQRRVVIGGLNSQKGVMKSRLWPGGVVVYDVERPLSKCAKLAKLGIEREYVKNAPNKTFLH